MGKGEKCFRLKKWYVQRPWGRREENKGKKKARMPEEPVTGSKR